MRLDGRRQTRSFRTATRVPLNSRPSHGCSAHRNLSWLGFGESTFARTWTTVSYTAHTRHGHRNQEETRHRLCSESKVHLRLHLHLTPCATRYRTSSAVSFLLAEYSSVVLLLRRRATWLQHALQISRKHSTFLLEHTRTHSPQSSQT